MTVLVIAEHDNKELKPSTLNTITAAQAIEGDVHVLVLGHQCSAVVDTASQVSGVSKILLTEDAAYEHFLAENLAPSISKLASNYSHILVPASTFGKNIAPRVAALLDVAQLSEVMEVISADTFKRPIYAGNAIATVQSTDTIKVITVRTTAFDKAATEGGQASVEPIEGTGDAGLSSFINLDQTESERPELTSADIVISGGRGVGSAEDFALIEAVADKLGAAIGASRAAVDAGYVPNDYQVGQTGKVVAPNLYIAVGISGAIQHLAGMKDSKVIVAINKDENAPIFEVADFGLVADLFNVLPEMEKLLS